MEIKKAATAGTLESSDCMVTVEPGEGKIDFSSKALSSTSMATSCARSRWRP